MMHLIKDEMDGPTQPCACEPGYLSSTVKLTGQRQLENQKSGRGSAAHDSDIDPIALDASSINRRFGPMLSCVT